MDNNYRSRGSVIILSSFEGSIISFKGPLIEDLVKKQYTVYTLAPDLSQETSDSLIKLGAQPIEIKLSRTSFNVFRDLRDLFQLVLIMRRLNPVIFLGYYIKPVIWGGLAAYIARVPKRIVMIEGLGHIFTNNLARKPINNLLIEKLVSILYKASLAVCQFVLFLNNDDKTEFERRKIVKKNKAFTIGAIGLKLPEWPYLEPIMDPINFLFVGRLVEEKGLSEFISAAEIIKERYPSTTFAALGEIEKRVKKFSLDYLKNLDKKGLISIPGYVPVLEWLQDCSVFVLPSYREGIPRSTQEAMACGKPVITTNAPGCKETVIEGENGFLVPIGDINALVRAMEKFILKPSIISSMGAKSRQMAERNFDAYRVNKKIFEIVGI